MSNGNATTYMPSLSDKHDSGSATSHLLIFIIGLYGISISIYFMQRRVCRLLSCRKSTHLVDESNSEQMSSQNFPNTDNEMDCNLWTIEQVANWAESTLNSEFNQQYHSQNVGSACLGSYNSRGINKAISALKTQCIDGASLQYLTMQHLVSFGIPFGMAVHLSHHIDEIVSRNSSGMDGALNKDRLRSNLVSLPSWYEQDSQRMNDSKVNTQNDEVMDIEMQENVQQIMQDRFGMALPSLRESTNTRHAAKQNAISDIEPLGRMEPTELATIMQMTPINKQETNNDVPTATGGLSDIDDIIQTMPPHIRAITQRRPELVSEILSNTNRVQNTKNTSLDPIAEDEKDFNELRENDEVNYDSEYVGLLRRRTNNNR